MKLLEIDKVSRLLAIFTLVLVAGLLAGGWYFHGRLSGAFEENRRQALREQGLLIAAALEWGGRPDLERLRHETGLDRLQRLDPSGRPLGGDAWQLPPDDAELREALDLGLEYKPPPLRDGDELFLSLYLPITDAGGELEGFLLLESGAHLSTQLSRLRGGLWLATGAGALFVAFVLLSMAGILGQARRRQRQLDRAEHLAEVGTLSAGLAHEIRNPLAIILGNAELLEMRGDDEVAGRAREIVGETDRLRRLLDDFLRFARPRDLRLAPLAAEPFWAGLLEEQRALHPGLRFEMEAASGTPEVLADAEGLRQVGLNLLGNAATFARERVSLRLEGRDGGWRLSLKDDGPGVEDALRGRLFEPFSSGREGGTGLGLALSRAIARAHGGELALAPAGEGGAEFVLTLPANPQGGRP